MRLSSALALTIALAALAGCTDDEQKSGDAFLSVMGVSTAQPPDYSAGSQQVAQIIEVETLRMLSPDGGPMGEEVWTGPGCAPRQRIVVCQ